MRQITLVLWIALVCGSGFPRQRTNGPTHVFRRSSSSRPRLHARKHNNLVTPLPRTGSSITLGGILNTLRIPWCTVTRCSEPSRSVGNPAGPYKNAFKPAEPIYPK